MCVWVWECARACGVGVCVCVRGCACVCMSACFACVNCCLSSVYRSVLCDVAEKVNLFAREVTVDVVQSLGTILKHGSAVVKGVSQNNSTVVALGGTPHT